MASDDLSKAYVMIIHVSQALTKSLTYSSEVIPLEVVIYVFLYFIINMDLTTLYSII